MNYEAFDRIYEKKVGNGIYQHLSYFFMGLAALSDEAEMITLSVVLPVISREWNLSQSQQSILGTVFFLGFFLGSVGIGFVADKMGRKFSLAASSGLQFIFGIGSSFVQTYETLLIFRGIIGFLIGCSIPVAVSYVTEISVKSYRGKAQVFIQIFFVLGMFYATVMSLLFMQNLATGEWRKMLIAGAMPSLLVFLSTIFYIEESPRFLLSIGKFDSAVEEMRRIGNWNFRDQFMPLTSQEKQELQDWQKKSFESKDKASLKALFKRENLSTTIPLIFSWFGLSFNFYGIIFILPYLLSKSETQSNPEGLSDILQYFIVLFGEIPALVIAYFIVDHKFFGRKNSTNLGHLLAAISFAIAYFCRDNVLIGFLILSRLATKLSFITINPLTTELYLTNYRALALGFTSGVGRLGGVVMPSVSLELFAIHKFLPLLLFAVVAVIMVATLQIIPHEPLGKPLDHIIDAEKEEKKFEELKEEEEEEKRLLSPN